jgi:RNA polymerase sigma-70 factor (ECF subfamily)
MDTPLEVWSDEKLAAFCLQETASPDAIAPAFAELVRRFTPFLERIYRGRISDPEVEDLVQESFTRLWDRRGSFDPAAGPFRAWLAQLARRLLVDRLRRDRARPAVRFSELETAANPLPVDPEVDAPPEASAEQHELLELVTQALQLLTERQREVLIQRLAGMKSIDIARKLDVSPARITALNDEALKRLRTLLAGTIRDRGGAT